MPSPHRQLSPPIQTYRNRIEATLQAFCFHLSLASVRSLLYMRCTFQQEELATQAVERITYLQSSLPDMRTSTSSLTALKIVAQQIFRRLQKAMYSQEQGIRPCLCG